jgi:hypothetical protein
MWCSGKKLHLFKAPGLPHCPMADRQDSNSLLLVQNPKYTM